MRRLKKYQLLNVCEIIITGKGLLMLPICIFLFVLCNTLSAMEESSMEESIFPFFKEFKFPDEESFPKPTGISCQKPSQESAQHFLEKYEGKIHTFSDSQTIDLEKDAEKAHPCSLAVAPYKDYFVIACHTHKRRSQKPISLQDLEDFKIASYYLDIVQTGSLTCEEYGKEEK